jgi:uncharacterized membrane protein YbhN (UPF0104 family)
MSLPTLPVRAARVRVVVGGAAVIAITAWAFASRRAVASAVGQVWALPGPSWPPIVIAATAVVASYGFSALALSAAAGRWLPPGRTFLVQLAAAAANRITPGGLGGAAVNARFLTRQGLSVGATSAAISLTAVAHGVVALIGVLVMGPTLAGLPLTGSWGGVPFVVVAIAAIAAFAVVGGIALRRRRKGTVPFAVVVRDAWAALISAFHQPGRLIALIAATAAVKAAGLLALYAATQAFDGDVSAWQVAVVYLVGVPAAEAIPTPGGLGTVDGVLVAGLSHMGGDTVGAVVAAVVLFRLLTFWAPILPGVLAGAVLRRRCAL